MNKITTRLGAIRRLKIIPSNIIPTEPRSSMSTDVKLPPKPKPPVAEDCCDSGCNVCVKDVYQQEVKIWEAECRRLQLNQAEKSSMDVFTYAQCLITNVECINDNHSMYTFNCGGYVDIKPGQHLICRDKSGGEVIVRQYTPVKIPTPTDYTFNVIIKSYPEGCLTSNLTKRWIVGHTVEWRGPSGDFHHTPGQYNKYLGLAAGTGVAPFLSVAQLLTSNDNEITSLKLLYTTPYVQSLLLRHELKQLTSYWNFNVKYFVTRDSPDTKLSYGETGVFKRLSIIDIERDLLQPNKTRVLICGTKQFNLDMRNILEQLTFPRENIHVF